ncbi:MAG: hypothetical protein KAR06_02705 [Deltaproteobacteria bacterium]|nr:hypothetical protein [Deltaproteobacteria bacterium]
MEDEPERLVSLKLEDGSSIEFRRTTDNAVHICHGDHKVVFPKCTGQQTLDLLALLEPFGTFEEENDERTKNTRE